MGEPKFDRKLGCGLLVILLVILLFCLIVSSRPGFFQDFSPVY